MKTRCNRSEFHRSCEHALIYFGSEFTLISVTEGLITIKVIMTPES